MALKLTYWLDFNCNIRFFKGCVGQTGTVGPILITFVLEVKLRWHILHPSGLGGKARKSKPNQIVWFAFFSCFFSFFGNFSLFCIFQPSVAEQLPGRGSPGWGPPCPPPGGNETGPRPWLRLCGGKRETSGGPLCHARYIFSVSLHSGTWRHGNSFNQACKFTPADRFTLTSPRTTFKLQKISEEPEVGMAFHNDVCSD